MHTYTYMNTCLEYNKPSGHGKFIVGSCDAGQAMPAGHGEQVVDMAILW